MAKEDIYTKEELIDWIKKLSDGDKAPLWIEMENHPESPSPNTINKKFGSWTAAVKEAGFDERSVTYSDGQLLEWIRTLADGDNPPTFTEMDEHPQSPSAVTYHNRFGSWNEAVEKAGFKTRSQVNKRSGYTKEELIQGIKDASENDEAPTLEQMDNNPNVPSTTAYYGKFDSWKDALKEAGF